jgi:tetratricopeptide (TPR) repeat protein/predicted Ser/Thr protein kinase
MNEADRHERVTELFLAACELPADERKGFLARECGSDAPLRREVEAMLGADTKPESFLDVPVLGQGFRIRWTTTGRSPVKEAGEVEIDVSPVVSGPRPDRIGSFRVLDVLGEGGMGVVYLAEQEQPQRRVALKVLRPGSASPTMLRRFEHEAYILGRLQHPGIAQIYEAGVAEAGLGPQPFFAMELIEGRPLTAYAAEQELGVRERLELFTKVCDAVNHAHQKGVIHRDLKPGNILVDDTGQPKILDFGVARVTDVDIRTTTLDTAIGELIGTVPYMSPEQAAGDVDELDIRSDVYALGVICYELLSGQLPYDVGRQMVHEAVRAIRERDPKPLSAVSRVFRGDLETIVNKALEKDRQRRYQSASDLAADVQRYLSDQAIVARSPSALYQLRKFAKRNRALMVSACAIGMALILGLGGTTWQAIVATGQRDRAVAAEQRAERRFGQVRVLANAFIFDIHDEIRDLPGSTAAREKVAGTALEYLDSLIEDAADDRRLREEVAEAYLKVGDALGNPWGANLGDTAGALASYEKSAAIRKELADADPASHSARLDLAESYRKVGDVRANAGKTAEAMALYEQALALAANVPDTDSDAQRARIELAQTHRVMGTLEAKMSRTAEAEASLRRAVVLCERLAGGDPEDVAALAGLAKSHYELGKVQEDTSQTAEALASFERATELAERLCLAEPANTTHQRLLFMCHALLGDVLTTMARHDEALTRFEASMQIARAMADADPHNQRAQQDLGFAYERIGNNLMWRRDLAGALKAFRSGLEVRAAATAADPDDMTALSNLVMSHVQVGDVLRREGEFAEALVSYDRATTHAQRLADADPHDSAARRLLVMGFERLSNTNAAAGNTEAAMEAAGRLLDVARDRAELDPADTTALRDLSVAYNRLAKAKERLGRHEEALDDYRRALEIRRSIAEADPTSAHAQLDVVNSYEQIGELLGKVMNDAAGGLESYRRALEIREALARSDPDYVPERRFVAHDLVRIGEFLLATDRPAEAAEPLGRCVALREELVSEAPDRWPRRRNLIGALERLASSKERLARDEGTSRDDRLALLKMARAHHQRILELVESVKDQGVFSGREAELPAMIADTIAALDAEIEAAEQP